jgi:hypothetical protein
VNTTSNLLNGGYFQDDLAYKYIPVNTLFGAALISQTTLQEFSQDAWGNVKIPWLEYLDESTTDKDGWVQAPRNMTSDHYSSLIGLSLSQITKDVNTSTSFDVETSYWTLDCPFLGTPSQNDTYSQYTYADQEGAMSAGSTSLYLSSPTCRTSTLQLRGLDYGMAPRSFTYLDDDHEWSDAAWIAANCTIETSYVEVAIDCTGRTCTAVKIRRSRSWHPSAHWTNLDTNNQTSFKEFAGNFVDALKAAGRQISTPYQGFILDPYNAFNTSSVSVSTVSNQMFAIRLGQLLNTFWMAMLAPTATPKGLGNSNLTGDLVDLQADRGISAATFIRSELVLKCDNLWLAILFISATTAICLSICGMIATICRSGPEPGLNVSYLMKDSPFVDSPSVSSTLDVGDRVRACKNVFVKHGDVRCEEDVGYIAIGSHGVSNLRSRRSYR